MALNADIEISAISALKLFADSRYADIEKKCRYADIADADINIGTPLDIIPENNTMLFQFSGLMKIKEWTQKSLKIRLQKSLSHDWIHENKSIKFPLRDYYVQLEWKQKKSTPRGSETVTLTSIYNLIKQLQQSGAGASQMSDSSSVIIEGKIN